MRAAGASFIERIVADLWGSARDMNEKDRKLVAHAILWGNLALIFVPMLTPITYEMEARVLLNGYLLGAICFVVAKWIGEEELAGFFLVLGWGFSAALFIALVALSSASSMDYF